MGNNTLSRIANSGVGPILSGLAVVFFGGLAMSVPLPIAVLLALGVLFLPALGRDEWYPGVALLYAGLVVLPIASVAVARTVSYCLFGSTFLEEIAFRNNSLLVSAAQRFWSTLFSWPVRVPN